MKCFKFKFLLYHYELRIKNVYYINAGLETKRRDINIDLNFRWNERKPNILAF